MEMLKVTCWFDDSEKIVSKIMLENGYKCRVVKVINPTAIIMGRTGGLYGDKYEFFGEVEEINKLAEYLENSDLDVNVTMEGELIHLW